MMDAVIYGVMLSAKIVMFPNAPPEKRSNRSNSPYSPENICSSMLLSMPGTGILEPILKTMSIKSVKMIFLRSSGIFQAFPIV